MTETPKIIFLDIDGVLNAMSLHWPYAGAISPDCIPRLNRIIEATSARVVLSSSWRNLIYSGHMDLLGFTLLLRSHGFLGEIVGLTRQSEGEDEPRYKQIIEWLSKHPHGRYCVLDDDSHAFGDGYLTGVKTAGTGLTDKDADEAIAILNGESER